jgi:hypothetical protein
VRRDDFPASVITKLRERVGSRCSNPDCRVPTTGPGAGETGVSSIGVAAHITAASPGGPRFDPGLDVQARRSARNGIWLCANCSIAIDRDCEAHTVSLLRRWKTQAEERAKSERGKKLPNESDAIDTVSMALTGLPRSFVPSAISNVHSASSKFLESLDPRFTVSSSFADGASHFILKARESTQFSFAIDSQYEPDIHLKFQKLRDFGQAVEFDARAVSIEGSRLLEEILAASRDGKLTLSPMAREAVHKLWALDEASGHRVQFEDVRGTITAGRKRMNFSGTACGGIFSFSYSKSSEAGQTRATVNLQMDLQTWEELDVRHLPYLEPLSEFLRALAAGASFMSALVVDGLEVMRSRPVPVADVGFISDTLPLLEYAGAAASLAKFLGVEIRFRAETCFTAGELQQLIHLGKMAQDGGLSFDSVASPIEMTMVLGPGFEHTVSAFAADNSDEYWIQQGSETVSIFGSRVLLPPRHTHFKSVKRSFSKPLCDWKGGDEVTVTLTPDAGFVGSMRFEVGEPGVSNKPV